jgi:ABC-type phosphate transport system substrate-binding protein
MKNINVMENYIKTFVVSFILSLTSYLTFAQNDGMVLITNKSNAEGTNISKSIAKAILLGKRTRWDDKSKIVLAVIKPKTELGEKISQEMFALTGSQLNKYYLTMVFQGKISAPKFFNSEEELIRFVTSTDGAVGVVSKADADQVNVVKLND